MVTPDPSLPIVELLADALNLAEQIGKEADAKDLEIARLNGELQQQKQAAAPALPFKPDELLGLLGDLQTNGIIPEKVDLLKVAAEYQADPGRILKLARVIQNPVPADGRPFSLFKEASNPSEPTVVDHDGWRDAVRPPVRR
jgi:hypothetical protein